MPTPPASRRTPAEELEVRQKRGLDDTHFLQRFTPRRPRGRWSKVNRDDFVVAGPVKT